MSPGDSRWRVRDMTPADQDAMRALFHESFGHEMPPEQFRWKYGDGAGDGVGVWENDTLVAHYGGFGRLLWIGDTAVAAVQIGDVMVSPRSRGVLTRRGPFVQAATSYFERRLAPRGPAAFAFGFPSRRHLDLGRLLGIYDSADQVADVRWTLHDIAPPGCWYETRRLVRLEGAYVARTERLVAAMRRDLPDRVVGDRSASYLNYRYGGWGDYALYALLLRPLGLLVGLFAIRAPASAGGECELLDVIGRLRHFPVLSRAAGAAARTLGAGTLHTWATTAPAAVFARCGATVEPTDVDIAVSTWPDPQAARGTQGRFWLLSGDTDFR